MGQKVNSNLLRLGIFNNEWKSKYIEKNTEESSLLVFQDIEIKKFIERFFKNSGIIASDINISRCNKNIIILIPYFIVSDCISHIFNDNDFILGNYDNKNNCNPQISTKKNRNYCLSLLRKNYYEKKFYNKKEILVKNFLGKIISVLGIFFKKGYNIKIITQNLNKSLSVRLNNRESIEFRKLIINLRSYNKSKFFKEFINILILLGKKKNSSNILIKFMGLKLSGMKKHNYFINFIKRAFIILINSKISHINGLKLIVKGRLNGSPRYKTKMLQIGSVPLQTLKSNIVYNEFVVFSNNGTIGLKLWLSEN